MNLSLRHLDELVTRLCCNAIALLALLITLPVFAISKSPNDPNEYRSITLNNGLSVLLISNPETHKAAASLDVNVGSASDPDDFLGTAHFLEHMLFLGTEKFPEPGEYQSFIDQHGGHHNAYTSATHTNYFFDIDPNYFDQALERFSEQFKTPLFNSEYVSREREIVHSEYTSKLKDDGRRFYDALKVLLPEGHPLKRFSVGNRETLADRENETAREAMLAFYRTYYSTERMRLVMMDRRPLEVLERSARLFFEGIPQFETPPLPDKKAFFNEDDLPLKMTVGTLKDRPSLMIAFPTESAFPYPKRKPLLYLSNLLGHEGKGSLLSALKDRGWVTSLGSGTRFDNQKHAIASISLGLTPQGVENIDAIMAYVFKYIELIKSSSLPRIYFEEQQKLLELSFNNQEKFEPIALVRSLSSRLHDVSAEEVLIQPYQLEEFDPELISDFLDQFSLDNMAVILSLKDFDSETRSVYYNTPYQIESISQQTLDNIAEIETLAGLRLPEANPFIPDNLQMISGPSDQKPELLDSGTGYAHWHASNTEFNTPRANLFVSLRSSIANQSPELKNAQSLFTQLINDALAEFTYPAYLAGLHYELYDHARGISLKISGYSDKQLALASQILDALMFAPLREDRYDIFKNRMARELGNFKQQAPYHQAIRFLQHELTEPSWSEQARLDSLKNLTVSDIEAFRDAFLKELQLVLLTHGNMSAGAALNAGQFVKAILGSSRLTSREVAKARIARLEGTEALTIPLYIDHPDTGFVRYIQGESKRFSERALFSLYTQAWSSQYYSEMRTEKKLGYVVFATNVSMREVPGLAFIIQSPSADGPQLSRETTEFITRTEAKISDETLDNHKAALTLQLQKDDNTLYAKSNRFWLEIDRENDAFDTREQLVAAINSITAAELQSLAKRIAKAKGKQIDIYSVDTESESAHPSIEVDKYFDNEDKDRDTAAL